MSSSWSEGVRAAQEAEQRRGRLVGKDADDVRTFAEGSGTCVSCGTEGSAGLSPLSPSNFLQKCARKNENQKILSDTSPDASAGNNGSKKPPKKTFDGHFEKPAISLSPHLHSNH